MSKKSEEIRLKLEKSKAIMEEVGILIANKLYDTAINRLYYSCFHATKALLLTKDLMPKTHNGVGTLLQKEFVQKGLFDKQHATLFIKLMVERHESDYGDYLVVGEEDIEQFYEPAKSYVLYVTKMVEDYLRTEEQMKKEQKNDEGKN